MKIFLQQVGTGCYIKPGGNWTYKLEEALQFPSGLSALDYANQHDLPTAQVLYRFDGGVDDIVVRLHDNLSFGAPQIAIRGK